MTATAGPTFTLHRAPPTPAGAAAFAAAVLPFLARREAANNLQLAVLDHVAAGRYPDPLLLYAEDAHGDVAAVLMRTPPHALLVPQGGAPAAREALLQAVLDEGHDFPGMVGPLPEVAEAAAWWSERTGRPVRRGMHLGVYRLRQVRPAQRAPGRARPAHPGDAELVIPWLEAFQVEAHGRVEGDPAAMWASFEGHDVRRLYVWEDEACRVASLAGVSGRTPNGRRIGPVYTPPARRRRGFAEALVAAVSQAQLGAGARFCFLFTDLELPTSNAIYRSVGYEQVGEAAEERFVDPAGG